MAVCGNYSPYKELEHHEQQSGNVMSGLMIIYCQGWCFQVPNKGREAKRRQEETRRRIQQTERWGETGEPNQREYGRAAAGKSRKMEKRG